MDFFELIKKRKSIRSFSPEPVSRDIIEKILEAGTYAPSNCNQQLWNFIIIQDNEIKERLIKEAASNTLLRRAPVLVAVTYDGWNTKEAIQGASLAVGHILLAASALGVGSLPMNSYGADSKVKQILGIPKKERVCCFIALGYPDERAEKAPLVPRRPVHETIHYNVFSPRATTPPFTYNPNEWTKEALEDHQRYYSRKTFLGKEMDIMGTNERALVTKVLKEKKGTLVDFLTYDGAYIASLPEIPTTFVDLTHETSLYTKEAARLQGRNSNNLSFATLDTLSLPSADTVTMLYKLERIPQLLRKDLFRKSFELLTSHGEFIIIARKRNPFISLYFFVVKMLFGTELRKTGIYNFFGPYEPIALTETMAMLKEAGFREISHQGFFPFPAFYEQLYQMFLQYIKSEGSSYLHREKRTDIISRILEVVIKFQGFRDFGRFGSVTVITCKK